MAPRTLGWGAGAAIAVAVACGGHAVDLGATRADDLPGGAPNDGGGAVGTSGTSSGATGGSGGSDVVDAAPDVEPDAGPPPPCEPILVYEFSPLACEVQLPQPWTGLSPPIIFLGINLIYRSPSGDQKTLGYVGGEASCESTVDGYYLVQPWAPRQIVICPDTCSALLADGGRLFAGWGCLRSGAAPR